MVLRWNYGSLEAGEGIYQLYRPAGSKRKIKEFNQKLSGRAFSSIWWKCLDWSLLSNSKWTQSARTAENCSLALWVIAQDIMNFGLLVHLKISHFFAFVLLKSCKEIDCHSNLCIFRQLVSSSGFRDLSSNQFPCKAATCAAFIIFAKRFAVKPVEVGQISLHGLKISFHENHRPGWQHDWM